MTLKDMEDVLEIREALDELAVQLACSRISKEQMERLHRIKEQFERSTRTGDIKSIAQADVDFHDVIYEATGNPKLVNLLNNLREQIYRYRVEYLKDARNYPVLIREHEVIVEALEAKDKERVTAAMHTHVSNQAAAVKTIIQHQE